MSHIRLKNIPPTCSHKLKIKIKFLHSYRHTHTHTRIIYILMYSFKSKNIFFLISSKSYLNKWRNVEFEIWLAFNKRWVLAFIGVETMFFMNDYGWFTEISNIYNKWGKCPLYKKDCPQRFYIAGEFRCPFLIPIESTQNNKLDWTNTYFK